MRVIQNNFPITVAAVEIITKGVNYTVRVTSNTTYYLKIFSPSRSPADLSFELSVMDTLRANNIGVATVVRSRQGAACVAIKLAGETRLAILYNNVGGRPLTNNSADIFSYTSTLAELHNLPTTDISQRAPRILCLEKECSRIQKSLKSTSAIPAPMRSKIARNCRSIQDQALHDCAVLCHGDAWLGNAKYADGRVYFIDFEDALFANRNFDLGAMAYSLTARDCNINPCIHWLLQGYNSRSATSATLNTIKPYIQLRSLAVCCFLLGHTRMDEQLIPTLLNRVEYFMGDKFEADIECMRANEPCRNPHPFTKY
ncbi:hypothetical protein AO391_23200 [Pseudomonas marginalis ICMP 9505]|uniref:Phosphotransferase n=1 Tax=Pseudomonas kitaguniensis TaxID=2607908 RepID=A0A5N7KRH2_9PSED|nr:phosphotransferase [Pseudomonas kitaguniensis]KTC11394.1 hypothetical protein AO391_23200 [Pseudomonas marginalis ICMP 9505]MPR04590.1 phosphotransferase [Pseudomonas kitaguniensis]